MANLIELDLSQNIPNALTAYADAARAQLIPKNDYNKEGNQYSATNEDALADGDRLGRGTGVFLDVYNSAAGTIDDITERNKEVVINKFNRDRQYPNFPISNP